MSHVTLINHELLLKKGGKGEVTFLFGRSCVKTNKFRFKGKYVNRAIRKRFGLTILSTVSCNLKLIFMEGKKFLAGKSSDVPNIN